jgi:hypothetical protein
MATYESPELTDYGTLLELTQAGTVPNADVPNGNNDTAFSVG